MGSSKQNTVLLTQLLSSFKRFRNRLLKKESKCLSNLQMCQNVQLVTNLFMQQKKNWLVDTNGIKSASNVPCVIKCWTQPIVQNMTKLSFAKLVMPENLDPKVWALVWAQGR